MTIINNISFLFQTNEKKIHELETKQRIIESSFQNLRQLKQEFSHINQEAQFNNENIHSFLSSFLPDYRCIKEPPREPSPNVIALKENNNNDYKPQVQIDFKIENGDGSTVATQKLPTPTISYEWSDSSPSKEFSPSYLPRMGKNNLNLNIFIFTFFTIWHKSQHGQRGLDIDLKPTTLICLERNYDIITFSKMGRNKCYV